MGPRTCNRLYRVRLARVHPRTVPSKLCGRWLQRQGSFYFLGLLEYKTENVVRYQHAVTLLVVADDVGHAGDGEPPELTAVSEVMKRRRSPLFRCV